MQMNTSTVALLIVDMQKGMQNPSAGKRNNPQAEENIAKLLTKWRKDGAPIVHIRHISRANNSTFAPGQSGVEFQDKLMPLECEHVVEKNVPDAFVNSSLEKWLRIRNCNELVIVGVSTNISVESTARSAGNLGFNTIVVSDATYTFDKVDFDGQLREASVVHAMALANLDGEFSRIIRTEELLIAK
jgi:nicotinamidase-related amidase